MKVISFFFIFFLSYAYSQKTVDTIYVVVKEKFFSDTSFFENGYKQIYKKKKNIYFSSKKKKPSLSLTEKFNSFQFPYIIFFLNKVSKKPIEEGYWNKEAWHDGYYCFYHLNGKKKSEGIFFENMRIGKWNFYDYNGKLVDTIIFPENYGFNKNKSAVRYQIRDR